MSENNKNAQIVDDMLNKAIDLTDGRTTYITNVRFHLGINELLVDLYQAGPNPSSPENAQAYRIQRIALPINVAHNFADLLKNAMNQWQELMDVNLPIQPKQSNLEEEFNETEDDNLS